MNEGTFAQTNQLVRDFFIRPTSVNVSERIIKEYGFLIEALGYDKFLDLCKRFGGITIPKYKQLLGIIRREKIMGMYEQGHSRECIAQITGLGHMTIANIIAEEFENVSVNCNKKGITNVGGIAEGGKI